MPIGVLTGMLAFVPYVGFTIGLLLALSMAILDWQSAGTLVGVIAVMAGVQIIDGDGDHTAHRWPLGIGLALRWRSSSR